MPGWADGDVQLEVIFTRFALMGVVLRIVEGRRENKDTNCQLPPRGFSPSTPPDKCRLNIMLRENAISLGK